MRTLRIVGCCFCWLGFLVCLVFGSGLLLNPIPPLPWDALNDDDDCDE